MRFDSDGWLSAGADEPKLVRVPTKRTCALVAGGPRAVVWHWTASGANDARGDRDSLALAQWIADPASDAKASWHVLIDRTGTVIQSAPVTVGTWHVGKVGKVEGVLTGLNASTVGVELENLGELREVGGWLRGWPWEAKSPVVDRAQAVARDGKLWHRYTPEQERSAELLVAALRERFGWPRSAFAYGHVHFDSPRKIDPGPVWLQDRLPALLSRVYGSRS